MSTIKSNVDHLVFNADGASKDIKFQANGVEKASISSAGAFTSTTIDATKLTGNLPAIDGSSLTGVGNSPYFSAENNATQNFSDATTTKVSFQTQRINDGGTYSTSNYRWTPGSAGKYYIEASLRLQTGGTWGNALMYIYKNGSNYKTISAFNSWTYNIDTHSIQGSIIEDVSATDYYEIYIYIDVTSTTTPNIYNNMSYFHGFKIG